MDAQLRLIPRSEARRADARPGTDRRPSAATTDPTEAPAQWRIDDTARERGRAGISRARQALAGRPPAPPGRPPHHRRLTVRQPLGATRRPDLGSCHA